MLEPIILEHSKSESVPYDNPQEHLKEEFLWLNRKLAAYVLKLRSNILAKNANQLLNGYLISDSEIDNFLGLGIEANLNASCEIRDRKFIEEIKVTNEDACVLRVNIDRRLQLGNEINSLLPLTILANRFNLSAIEIQTLIICLASVIDSRYDKVYAYLHDDLSKKYLTKNLILTLLGDIENNDLCSPFKLNYQSPLFRYGLVEIYEKDLHSLSQNSPIRIDPRIAQFILGFDTIDEKISSLVKFAPPISWNEVIIPSAYREKLNILMDFELSQNGRTCLYLHGRQGVGKKSIAQALCGDKGIFLIFVDMQELLHNPEEFVETIKRILREALLQLAGVCFFNVENLEKHDAANSSGTVLKFVDTIEELGWIIFLCGHQSLSQALLNSKIIYPIEVNPPQQEDQLSLWKLHLKKLKIKKHNIDFDQLVSRFNLTGGQINNALQRAYKVAHVRDPLNSIIDTLDLIISSRTQSQPKLSSLAKKINSNYCWEDIVLPEWQTTYLQEMISQVKHRHTVMNLWGFKHKLSLGRGLNALFTGPSGTGKTMAAEVIANELGFDLYKIDLSAVVSKYIGETEKNLNRLFDEAEHSNAILFFDEADALLGKRSEVKDAHDRFANIEIAYLLQKMEEYEGITILSTNLRQNIDDAFIRRIQYIVDFPFPASQQRELIWGKVFPKDAPIDSEIDFAFLANRFKLTGGNIKNIAVRSSYYAAEQGNVINMLHVVRATKRELQKAGTLFTEADFEKYAENISDK